MKQNLRSLVIFIFIFVLSLIIFILSYTFFLKSAYPIKYENIVNDSAKRYNIEPELIYAVIKSESGFDANAKSSAGALGLMQITPDTFDWLQTYTKEEFMGTNELFNPQVNIRYGTLFLSMLRGKYDSEELVLCAYNAGMTAVDRWLRDERISNFGQGLKFIPYNETKDYVMKIKTSKRIYKSLYFGV